MSETKRSILILNETKPITTQSILNDYKDLGKLTTVEKNNLINRLIFHSKNLEKINMKLRNKNKQPQKWEQF